MLQNQEYLVSTVDTDGLVLQHQGISSYSAEYAPMHFLLFMGWIDFSMFLFLSQMAFFSF